MILANLYKTIFFRIIGHLIILFLFNSCEKIEREPKVETGAVTDITINSAVATGNIIDQGDGIIDYGHCWRVTSPPTTSNFKTSFGRISRTGSYTSILQSLSPGIKYYIRAYVKNTNGEVFYGGESSFTTDAISLPTIITTPVTSINSTTAISGGDVTSDGGAAVTARGVCWSTNANPTVTLSTKTTNGAGTGSFTSNITGLTGNTTYYVRAYATNSAGTAYGNDLTFTTPVAIVPPSVTTVTTTATSSTTASSGGNVTSDGGATVTARGVCWSTSVNPTIAISTKTSNGSGTGAFTSSITGLSANTTYHVRAYATNSAGTAYGSDLTFTTSTNIVLPTVTTGTTTATSSTTATSGGNVTSDGGATVTTRGVCWSTSSNPTVALSTKTTNGTGTGSFTSSITGLAANTTYHVRAYATNSAGTSYGTDVTFTTLPGLLATIATNEVTTITSISAVSGGNISSDGGSAVTARGICWGTSSNPTLGDLHTTNGSGTGSFTAYLRDLIDGTTYHVRAYATNSTGTSYGNEVIFITPVTDISGNLYRTVEIGAQVWMAENLSTAFLNDGMYIPRAADNTAWSNLSEPGMCLVNDFSSCFNYIYGALYNWYAIGTGKLCPTGWHVPSDNEFKTLEMFLGMNQTEANALNWRGIDQGIKLKSTAGWLNEGNGTNASGFTGLPANLRHPLGGEVSGPNQQGFFWTSTEYDSDHAFFRGLDYYYNTVYRDYAYRPFTHVDNSNAVQEYNKKLGLSVRCIKD